MNCGQGKEARAATRRNVEGIVVNDVLVIKNLLQTRQEAFYSGILSIKGQ